MCLSEVPVFETFLPSRTAAAVAAAAVMYSTVLYLVLYQQDKKHPSIS